MSESADKTLELFQRRLQLAESHHRQFETRWQESERAYYGDDHAAVKNGDGTDADGFVRSYVKHAYQQVETLVPRFVDPDPQFEFRPQRAAWADNARAVTQLVGEQMRRDGFLLKQEKWARCGAIYGLMVAKTLWRYEEEPMRVPRPLAWWERMLRRPGSALEDVVLFDGPTAVYVDPFDFLWDPSASSMDDCRWVFHRTWVTKEDLRRREEAGHYSDVDKVPDVRDTDFDWTTVGERESRTAEQKKGGRIEVIEMWTRDRVVTVAERSIVLRDEPNPFDHRQIPFVVHFISADLNRFVGLSEVWSIKDLQRVIWFKENLRLSAGQLEQDPPVLYDESWAEGGDFKLTPGARIPVRNVNMIRVLDGLGKGTPIGAGEVDRDIDYLERITGINRSISAAPDAGGAPTATDAALRNREANMRLALKLLNVHQGFFARVAQQFWQLSRQFVDEPVELELYGPDGAQWTQVSPAELGGAFDVIATSSAEALTKDVERQALMEIINTMAPFVGAYQTPDGRIIDLEHAFRRLLQLHSFDPDRFFRTPPPPPPGMPPAGGPPPQGPPDAAG